MGNLKFLAFAITISLMSMGCSKRVIQEKSGEETPSATVSGSDGSAEALKAPAPAQQDTSELDGDRLPPLKPSLSGPWCATNRKKNDQVRLEVVTADLIQIKHSQVIDNKIQETVTEHALRAEDASHFSIQNEKGDWQLSAIEKKSESLVLYQGAEFSGCAGPEHALITDTGPKPLTSEEEQLFALLIRGMWCASGKGNSAQAQTSAQSIRYQIGLDAGGDAIVIIKLSGKKTEIQAGWELKGGFEALVFSKPEETKNFARIQILRGKGSQLEMFDEIRKLRLNLKPCDTGSKDPK